MAVILLTLQSQLYGRGWLVHRVGEEIWTGMTGCSWPGKCSFEVYVKELMHHQAKLCDLE